MYRMWLVWVINACKLMEKNWIPPVFLYLHAPCISYFNGLCQNSICLWFFPSKNNFLNDELFIFMHMLKSGRQFLGWMIFLVDINMLAIDFLEIVHWNKDIYLLPNTCIFFWWILMKNPSMFSKNWLRVN